MELTLASYSEQRLATLKACSQKGLNEAHKAGKVFDLCNAGMFPQRLPDGSVLQPGQYVSNHELKVAGVKSVAVRYRRDTMLATLKLS